jgi:hypothetical protein
MMRRISAFILLSAVLPTVGAAQALNDPASATIIVTSHPSGVMPATMIGIKSGSSEFGKPNQFFTAANARAVANLKALSPLPGQSCLISIGPETGVVWAPNGPGASKGQVSRADIDDLAAFVKAANCKLDYAAPMANNTLSNAADELSYVASAVGANLLAVGFGNEPDAASSTAIAAANYAKSWNLFARAALARNKNLRFKGPDTGIASNLGTWMTAWYTENSSLPLAYGTQHFYVAGPAGCSTCTENLMLESRSSQAYWNTMLAQKTQFESGRTKSLPVLMTETNNFYDGGAPGISNSYGAALYALDFTLQAAQAGFSGTAFTIVDNWSQGYSPLDLIDGFTWGPRPEYYGIYMAALMGWGPMLSTTVEDAPALHAYTVEAAATGTLNTAVINTTNMDYQANTVFPAGTTLRQCSAYLMSDTSGIDDTAASDLKIQGGHFDANSKIALQAPFALSVKGATAQIKIPAYSGVVVMCTH